ncbi:hypothetical protein K1719_002021 [Acacia pycnantha]|nr:hypothetical protein K1719_002021 [Acacia pycnantha]
MGGRIDHSINSRGGGPYSFVLSGQNHHFIGSLLPPSGESSSYAQPYIYDTENEISNRMSTASRYVGVANLDHNIVEILKECLDKHNCVVKNYRKAGEIIKENVIHDPAIVWEQTKELICEDLLHINHGDKGFQASVRSTGGIILNVASSGIAATLLPSGRTAHSRLVYTVMLIRNIDQAAGMCNGTRLQISQLGKNVIKAKALNGTSIGEEILIHRMDMNPSETKLPFNMTRRQFPIIISFAMTINKSQGQSMTNVFSNNLLFPFLPAWLPGMRGSLPSSAMTDMDMDGSNPFLPHDIITNILIRLPEDDGRVGQVKVYSLSIGSWKDVQFGNLDAVAITSDGFSFNGAIFWIGYKIGLEEDEDEVGWTVSFDLAMEVFALIPMPSSLFSITNTPYPRYLTHMRTSLLCFLTL